MNRIAIFSGKGDLHAHVVNDRLNRMIDCQCQIFETDSVTGNANITWSPGGVCQLLDHQGQRIELSELDLLWWRRSGKVQKIPEATIDDSQLDLINNDCAASILGSVLTQFTGHWVSDPFATTQAENKLYQLAIAQRVGFTIPRTLVSQSPDAIRQFCDELDHEVIVKPVRGTGKQPLFTRKIQTEHLEQAYGMQISPATYQEAIDGFEHLRINCFGSTIKSVLIEADRLDWRENLDVPIYEYQLSQQDQDKVHDLLSALNLRMGIIDCKINSQGELVWLEINPQGQFLFLEGITEMPMTDYFIDFLKEELSHGLGMPSLRASA